MSNLLIISATKNSNFQLSISIKDYIEDQKKLSCEVISLEDFGLPLYTPTLEGIYKKDKSFPKKYSEV